MTLIELYHLQGAQGKDGDNSRELLNQTHWFVVNVEKFDPKTGEALPQALSTFLAQLTRTYTWSIKHDRLWRITEHARPSVERLLRSLNESPRREHALMPVHAVRELDANSFIKLSARPGRNIREKLAGKPYLQAVRRFQSVNLPENRLLKAFVIRLAELLELRRDCLGEEEDELLPKIYSWLRSDEAKATARWDNLPPNNTLLSHRDYRRVWDAWRWLQSLDDDIARDFLQVEARKGVMKKWNDYGQMYFEGMHLFAEMPVLFDYEKFEINPWIPRRVVEEVTKKISRSYILKIVFETACVDLTTLRPRYAISEGPSVALRDAYLWQQWKNDSESVDIELFHSDAAHLHPDATYIASPDLFFSNETSQDYLDRAARAFASRLRATFKNDTLIWLVPDFLNDFEIGLGIIRRNINARFSNAEPLPRSVAAVFEQVDYSRIKGDGFTVVVVDYIGGKTCVTKLIARLDPELKKRLPETNGFYWERCPSVIISQKNTDRKDRQNYDIITVDEKERWHDRIRSEKPQNIDPTILKRDRRFGQFSICVNLNHSPVIGGISLHALQQRAGNIPLWRYQIPELSMLHQRFCLVGKEPPAKPIRGLPLSIPVHDKFTLQAGKKYYRFPLYHGENAHEIGYSACLDSPAFPLKTDAVCKLNLSFEYGADEPYKLIFTPLNKSFFSPIRATLMRTEEVIITDAPSPDYPTPMTWERLRHFPDTKRGGTINLIQEIVSTERNLYRWLQRDDDDSWKKLNKSIKSWCRFLFFQVWRDGRSISDSGFPTECADAVKSLLAMLRHVVTLPVAGEYGISQFGVMVLFCAMHRDMPEECVQWITEQVKNGNIRDPQAVGFALGDVTEAWQQRLFDCLASNPDSSAISVFAYAIWRNQHFVDRFSIGELHVILDVLSQRLVKILSGGQGAIHNWSPTTETLELLYGLLRTRASSDLEIRMLLQPHQKTTKELVRHIERIAKIIAQSNVNLFSRVQIDVKKPEGDRTPDLLYALRLYLTGHDDAITIHTTSVSDSDE
jgi:hypothetical protein